MAVTPWTITPPMVSLLNTLDVPRATPTVMPMIQAAEKNQTIIVAIHHHISLTSFSLKFSQTVLHVICFSLIPHIFPQNR